MEADKVKVLSNNGMFICIPKDSTNHGPISFGGDGCEATITLTNPTPAEARALSPPQRRVARAHRAQVQKNRVIEDANHRKRGDETPKSATDGVERRSAFARLSYTDSRPMAHRAPLLKTPTPQARYVPEHRGESEEKLTEVKLSRRQRKNRSHQKYKASISAPETPTLSNNPFFPLTQMGKEGSSSSRRVVLGTERRKVTPSSGRRQQATQQDLRDTLQEIRKRGLNPMSQSLAKNTMKVVQHREPVYHGQFSRLMSRDYKNTRPELQTRWPGMPPRYEYRRIDHSSHRFTHRDVQKSNNGRYRHTAKKKMQWVAKSHSTDRYSPKIGEAPLDEEALPVDHKGKILAPTERTKDIMDFTEEEFDAWIKRKSHRSGKDDSYDANEDDLLDDFPSASIHMVEARVVDTSQPHEAPTEEQSPQIWLLYTYEWSNNYKKKNTGSPI